MESVRVSICLPTWQGAADLQRLLPVLRSQRVDGGVELVAIDSDSTDGTRELLLAHGVRVERIAQRDFGHGRTRNALAHMACGEVLVYLSQDALPQGADFVARLVRRLTEPRVAAVTARILPPEHADPLTRRAVLDAPQAGALSQHYAWLGDGSRAGLCHLNPGERAARVGFDNVAAAYKGAVLRSLPFPDVAFGEDAAWAELALRAGHELVFEPEAVVQHAHQYSPKAAWARWRTDAAFQRTHLGRRVRPTLWSALKGYGYELRRDWAYLQGAELWRYLPQAMILRGAQVGGAWAGSRGRIGPSSMASSVGTGAQ